LNFWLRIIRPTYYFFGPSPRRVLFLIAHLALLFLLAAPALAESPVVSSLLTTASQVRELTPEQAALGHHVRIRGVITMDAPAPDFFIQDSTAGVFVEGDLGFAFYHHLGALVELEGVTGPGKFAPVIREQSLRVLGKGDLPKATVHRFSDLADGQMDSQWVQVRGIVRSVAIDRSSWHEMTLAMRVSSEGGELGVRVPIDHEQDFSSWIDSEVLIEGVCGSLFTSQRQLSGILLYVPRLSFIRIEAPSTEVPFSALLRFSPGQGARHRVRVRGVVAYQLRGSALFLQSGDKGLRVLTQQDTPLQVGDLVDVLGFPSTGESAPVLTDAVFHRIGHGVPPIPVKLALESPWEEYDGALVETQATLLDRQLQPGGIRLLLRNRDFTFDASLPSTPSADRVLSLALNTQVSVAGICLVRSGGLWTVPQSFRLLLRSPSDIVVIHAPSWWNLRHTMWLLGVMAAILLMVVAWVVVLGRRLREAMATIRQKLRSGAVLEERNRIARELHDTIEQELAGITMQLDLASDCFHGAPNVAQQALETARSMSRHSMNEARRSVWDLRCHLLENGDLVSALSGIIRPLALHDQVKIEMKISGEPARLPGAVEMNLLRIGQEAVANAVKHACARNIQVELRYARNIVGLTVHDDGMGFSVAEMCRVGHFGLLDMRERAQFLGSVLHIDSAPTHGTTISLEVPLSDRKTTDEGLEINTNSCR
jgi:signal transduction histidine kinase